MNSRVLKITMGAISAVADFLVTVSVLLCAFSIIGTGVPIKTLLTFALIFVCFYLTRRFAKSIILFAFLHMTVPFFAFLMLDGSISERAVYAVLMFALLIYSFSLRLKTKDATDRFINPAAAGIIMATGAILAAYKGNETYTRIIYTLALALGMLYFLHLYLARFAYYDYVNRKVIVNLPSRGIIKTGAPYVGLMALFYFVSAFLCLNREFIESIGLALKNAIKSFLVWLVSLFPEATEETTFEEKAQTFVNTQDALPELTASEEPSMLAEILERIFTYIAVIVAFAAIVALIGMGVLTIVKKFSEAKAEKTVDLTDDYVEEREKVDAPIKQKAKRNLVFSSYADRIRAIYAKIARENSDLASNPELITVREFANLFTEDRKEAMLGFSGVYEKARYSPQKCTKEDLKKAREFAKAL